MRKTYRYRFYPTPEQEDLLVRTFGCVRYVYNRALSEKIKAWSQEQRNISYVETSKNLTEWKKEYGMQWLSEAQSIPLQQSLRNLQSAYSSFWNKKSKYPKFKSKNSKQSAIFVTASFSFRSGKIKLSKMKQPLNIRWSRYIPNNLETSRVIITKTPSNKWFISIPVDEKINYLGNIDNAIGIDLGITSLLTLSDGTKIPNLKYFNKYKKKLAKAQKELSRKKKGSKNRNKARIKVATIYEKIANSRKDYLHKISTQLVRENQTIVIEDLKVNSMMSKNLSGPILDASWVEFRRQLNYKSEWYRRDLIIIDRYYPSTKLCSNCSYINNNLKLSNRIWNCPQCNSNHDRDINAAKNILAVGLAVKACGANVRPNQINSEEATGVEA